MTRLEALTKGAAVRGIVPGTPVTVVAVDWISPTAVELTYKTPDGRVANRLLYRDDEAHLELLERPAAWAFDGDGDAFRLVAEAKRIDLAYLFDPYVAVSTALVEPLPHQITAVYEEMLPRQPLRFLLADDPGAGKTIMTGLYIRELLIRADLRRCLIVAPGNLVDLWQEELDEKLRLPFDILTTDRIETSRTGNPFAEHDLLIARLDKLARDDEPGGLQDRLLAAPEWDLVVFDEAHKLSAQLVADEVKETKRRRLAVRLRERTRHLLLLTATPHTGKPEEFELFMSLLDPDRFAGHRRSRAEHPPPAPDASDLMRRVVKERLVRFDGSPLFPPRRAFVKPYRLSPPEQHLYEAVTEYVRTEMDRADRLRDAGERARGVVVGFALTVLQRRLASSPEAIYRSLRRRRERLERRLAEVERQRHAAQRMPTPSAEVPPLEVELTTAADAQELLEFADDAPAAEVERLEETLVDLATAATTVAELQTEIESLRRLERLAAEVRRLGTDAKWSEFAELLQDSPEMRDAAGARRKLVVFTEHRDTLEYLVDRLATLLGRPEQIVAIHGGLARGARRAAEARLKTDPEAVVLVATDAAGEGINLQRAHLMVNYDLPWNPNRLEQRFGRIHRIGQTEPCYLWNLVAIETREGDVYATLLDKLTRAAEDLGGQVFDVLGELTFGDRPLRDLLIEAIRSGARPETWAEIERDIDAAVDRERLQRLLDERALGAEVLDTTRIQAVREAMDRANARRLQPHFIRSFFLEAFRRLGGAVVERERGRYEITHVPIRIREAARRAGLRPPVQRRYERITFEKDGIAIAGLPLAEFVCPGHPLLDATIDVLLADHTDLLGRGTILIDSDDPSEEPRVLVFLEDVIVDARSRSDGRPSVVSRRLDFVELFADGRARNAGPAPYHDYEPLAPELRAAVMAAVAGAEWLSADTLKRRALGFAAETVSRGHLEEVRRRTLERVAKIRREVTARLRYEINYWDRRAAELALAEEAGKTARLNSARAKARADELSERLETRLRELEAEERLDALPPVVVGAALVVPAGLVARLAPEAVPPPERGPKETAAVEAAAMAAVLAAERAAGFEPRDVSAENLGYDVEARDPTTGRLRYIEVKGRAEGATTITVTRNEILCSLNVPEQWYLAIVEVRDGQAAAPVYLRAPFRREPDFGATSVTYSIRELVAASGAAV
jgi:superfamily II DNA or RNA helicase